MHVVPTERSELGRTGSYVKRRGRGRQAIGSAWAGSDDRGCVVRRHGLVESRMRWKPHVRFGGRAGETDLPKGTHRAPVRSHLDNDVRRRRQQSVLGHRGHNDDPLYRTRRFMTRGWKRLSGRQREKLFLALAEGDPTGEVGTAILVKALLRESYFGPTARRAHWRLERFYANVAEADVAELTLLATTISRWEQEVFSVHTARVSTGPVEAQNLVAEKIRRVAHCRRNFENYRLRVLLHSGVQWDTRPTARIRGRPPRLGAIPEP